MKWASHRSHLKLRCLQDQELFGISMPSVRLAPSEHSRLCVKTTQINADYDRVKP